MAENPDVIYYIGRDPIQAGQFSLSAYTLGMTNVVIGWSGEGDDSVLTGYAGAAGAAAAENDYVALQYRRFEDMPGWATFLSAYQAANFPHEPNNPGTFGAFAYDAARIIMAAIDRADSTNPVAIRSQIAAAKNYEGIVGTYRGFDACGDVIPQWAWLERYQNGQWIFLVQSAPASSCSRKIFLPIVLRDF
jgi:branched-chain amino acid transport system substrate-binding protein